MVHLQRESDIFRAKFAALWLLAAFKAGFLNSAGFFALGSFVSHVTGFGTHLGIALAHSDYFFGIEILLIPFSFIFGGIVTSWVLDGDARRNEYPRYYLIQGLITLLIGVVIILGEQGYLGFVGEAPLQTTSYGILQFTTICLLCFVCGLKNALVTWATKGKIRVTHLTGLSTDLGLQFLKMFRRDEDPDRLYQYRLVNFMRLATFTAFTIGAAGSAVLMPLVGYKGFFVAMGISLGMTILSIYDAATRPARKNADIWQVADGSKNLTQGAAVK